MDLRSLVASAVVILSAVLIVWVPFVVWPRFQRSRYRYKLWALRDELWDGLHDGVIPPSDAAARLLRDLETQIRHAPTYAAVAWLVTYSVLRGDRQAMRWIRRQGAAKAAALASAPAAEHLESLRTRMNAAAVHHFVWGSSAGVVLTPLLAVLVRGRDVVRGGRAKPGALPEPSKRVAFVAMSSGEIEGRAVEPREPLSSSAS